MEAAISGHGVSPTTPASKRENELVDEVLELRRQISELERREADRQRLEASVEAGGHQAQKLLLEAVESLREIFVLWDAEDRLVLCNEAFRKMNEGVREWTRPGTRYEDYLRAAVAKGLVPGTAGREAEWIAERLHRFHHPGPPFEIPRQDGQWLLNHETRMPNGSTVTIATDITERKRAEAALSESEARFHHFAEASGDWFWEMDGELRFTWVSADIEKHTGVPREWHYGKTREETDEGSIDPLG